MVATTELVVVLMTETAFELKSATYATCALAQPAKARINPPVISRDKAVFTCPPVFLRWIYPQTKWGQAAKRDSP
jgi:hypothetical protein